MEQGQAITTPPIRNAPTSVPADMTPVPRRRTAKPRQYLTVLLFAGPALVLIGLLVIYPAIRTIINSFFITTGIGYNAPTAFTGWTNYVNLFSDPNMQTAIRNNILWLIVVTPVTVILGVVFAVLFDRVRYEAVAKSIVFIPMAISATAAGIIWVLMYADNPHVGTINAMLAWLGAGPISFLGDAQFVNWALMGAQVWMGLGFPVFLISVIWLLPTVSLLFTSVRGIQDINTSIWWTVLWKPHQVTLVNYQEVFKSAGQIGMGQAFLNSVLITVPATILPIVIGAWAAYAFAWLRFPLRNTVFLILVALQVIPLQMLLIPLLRLFTDWHLTGTYPALWLAHTAFGLPLAIYIMRNFMSGIPYDLLESARIDGAGEVRIFWSIILPLTTPAIAAMAIFQFMWVWNDLLIALVFAGPTTAPMPVIVRTLVGEYGAGWQFMTSAAFISMALPLIIFFSLQRYFVTGLTAGSVKG